MTQATRQALEQVARILHDAGWDRAEEPPSPPSPAEPLAVVRRAYETLLRPDHFLILEQTLRNGASLQEAARSMGVSEGEADRLFREALDRLSDFVEVSAEQGFLAK